MSSARVSARRSGEVVVAVLSSRFAGDPMSLRATEVFVPGAYPQHTYVQRSGLGLEQVLRDAISTPGFLVSLAGPSKSGKTVLVERVIGRDQLIPVSGGSVR